MKAQCVAIMNEIEKLLDIDHYNETATIRNLSGFDPDLTEAIEDAAVFFKTICRIFSHNAQDDEDLSTLKMVGIKLNCTDQKRLFSIFESNNYQDHYSREVFEQGKKAHSQLFSRRVRTQLLLLAQRSYCFAATDLLRLRLGAAMAHYRIQIEAACLAKLIHEQPEIAFKWLTIKTDKDGRKFFRKYHSQIKEIAEKNDLAALYNSASGIAMHARFGSIADGLINETFVNGNRRVHETKLSFQDIKEEDFPILILRTLNFLFNQYGIFLLLLDALPEVNDPLLIETRIPKYREKLNRLWDKMEKVFPSEVAGWKSSAV